MNLTDGSIQPFSPLARAVVPGWYRHYKGGRHEVVGLGRHSETLEELVVYHHEGAPEYWVRPVSMWSEMVEFDGKRVPRFTPEKS